MLGGGHRNILDGIGSSSLALRIGSLCCWPGLWEDKGLPMDFLWFPCGFSFKFRVAKRNASNFEAAFNIQRIWIDEWTRQLRLLPPKGKPQNVTHMYLCTHMYTYVSCFFVFSSLSSITECGGTFVEPMLNMMSCILHPYDAGHVWRGLPHFRRSWDKFASQYHPINYYPLSDSPARKTMQGVGGETLQMFTFST
jgi:hypothetical protein